MDWCKLMQSIEAALDIREGLGVLRTRAEALAAVGDAIVGGNGGHEIFLARLLGENGTVYRLVHLQLMTLHTYEGLETVSHGWIQFVKMHSHGLYGMDFVVVSRLHYALNWCCSSGDEHENSPACFAVVGFVIVCTSTAEIRSSPRRTYCGTSYQRVLASLAGSVGILSGVYRYNTLRVRCRKNAAIVGNEHGSHSTRPGIILYIVNCMNNFFVAQV